MPGGRSRTLPPMSTAARLVMVLMLALVASCAHGPPPGPAALTTFDYVDDEGTTRTLARYLGKVVLLDLCLASLDPCLLNAKAVSEACDATCSDEVVMITLLMDGMGPEPVASYRTVLKVPEEDGELRKLDMGIRYQDVIENVGGICRYLSRNLECFLWLTPQIKDNSLMEKEGTSQWFLYVVGDNGLGFI